MILKYLFLIVSIAAIIFGIRHFTLSTNDLIRYYHDENNIFKKVDTSNITVIEHKIMKFGSTSNPDVYLASLENKKIAIINQFKHEKSVLLKRTPEMDAGVNQIFSEKVHSFEVVKNVFFYFVFRYFISIFLVLFGLLFLLGAYVIYKKGEIV